MLARLNINVVDVGGTLLKQFKSFGTCALAEPDDARMLRIESQHINDDTGQITTLDQWVGTSTRLPEPIQDATRAKAHVKQTSQNSHHGCPFIVASLSTKVAR